MTRFTELTLLTMLTERYYRIYITYKEMYYKKRVTISVSEKEKKNEAK